MTTNLIKAKAPPGVRAEVTRLLTAVEGGLSPLSMARISKMRLADVVAALAELETSGDYWRKPVIVKGQVVELWAKK